MLTTMTPTAIINQATTFYAELNTVILVAAGCLLAFAVGRYAIRLVKKGAR